MTDSTQPSVQVAPAINAVPVTTSGPVQDTPEGLKAWFDAQAHKVEQVLHEVSAHIEGPVKSAETAASAVIGSVGKVEGDVVADLKALVDHLHAKYDAVVERVRKLETHLGFA